MHSLVLVLMVLVCFNFMLKQTWHKKWSVAAHALAAALFTGFMWPFAIEQSRSQIDEWLSNPALMLDTSVIITVEVILQMAFCLLCVHLTGSHDMALQGSQMVSGGAYTACPVQPACIYGILVSRDTVQGVVVGLRRCRTGVRAARGMGDREAFPGKGVASGTVFPYKHTDRNSRHNSDCQRANSGCRCRRYRSGRHGRCAGDGCRRLHYRLET